MVRLDGLRGIAVLGVVIFHAGYYLVPSLNGNLLPGGFLGVDLFFVLSGFLMTNILLERKQTYRRFYLRRAARILPALYVFLAAQLLYVWATGSTLAGNLRADLLVVTGIGNWGNVIGIPFPFTMGQTWSLGVEEQFYLLWPLAVLFLCRRRDPGTIRRVCLVGVVVSLVAKLVMLRAGIPTPQIYGQTEARLDDFLAGAFVATLWYETSRPVRFLGPLTLAAGSFLVLALATGHPYASRWLYEGGFTGVAVSCAILLYACLHQGRGTEFAAARALRAAGRYSYSIYLWHLLIFLAVLHAVPHQPAERIVIAVVLLVAFAVFSTRVIEEPLRRRAAGRHRVTVERPGVLIALSPAA